MTRARAVVACGALLGLADLACLPDNGRTLPIDAPVIPPRADGAAGAGGSGGGSGGAGGNDAAADGPTATCTTVDMTLNVQTFGTTYLTDAMEVPAGLCLRYCVENKGGEKHTHTSDDHLFPDFVTNGGETNCASFYDPTVARPTPYHLWCSEHSVTMNWYLTVK